MVAHQGGPQINHLSYQEMTVGTTITNTEMTSTSTRHTARSVTNGWVVTWLPGRVLTREQAVTAMTIAEMVTERADILADPSAKLWWHMNGWAGELGITGAFAVAEASLSPQDRAALDDEAAK